MKLKVVAVTTFAGSLFQTAGETTEKDREANDVEADNEPASCRQSSVQCGRLVRRDRSPV